MPHHSPRSSILSAETLESRTMLSTVQIFASGDTGTEDFAVLINGSQVGQFTASQDLTTFGVNTDAAITADDVRIEFLNDEFNNGFDRNLRVDAIQVDGVRFETEDTSVFSTGTWTPADGVSPGNGRGEVLHANGYFQYSDDESRGSLIEIRARGDEGTEQFNLVISGETVIRFNASTFDRTFSYRANDFVPPSDVRVELINAQYDPANNVDSNLVVDFISIDGETFQTESQNVFSNGTWTPEDGIVPGNGRGDTLHANGFFEFGRNNNSGSTLEVIARGNEGGEIFNVLINGNVVRTIEVGTSFQTYTVVNTAGINANDVAIQFTNDASDPENGFDRNLIVDAIRIDGTTHQAEAGSTFSSGTWLAEDGVADGFGRGDTLHANGQFRFGVIDETVRYRVTFDGTWSPETHGDFPAGAHFSGLVGATHNREVNFWTPGQRASLGIENVAETGSKAALLAEVGTAISSGVAENVLSGGGITLSPDSVSLEFDASADFSLVSLVSMLAPSPDWFVGVHDFSLVDSSGWINERTIALQTYDAGTDDGVNFTSPDIDNPNGNISRITRGPLAAGGPVGTFRFERIG